MMSVVVVLMMPVTVTVVVEIVEIVVVTEMYHMDSVYSFHQIATYSERRTT